MSQAQFISAIQGAADYLGPGAIEVPLFEQEITDLVRRESVALARLKHEPATGQPHRYFEQLAVAQAQFQDPRNLAPVAASPTRVERAAFVKCLVNQSNIGLFDRDVTRQQGRYAKVIAKDIDDISNGVVIASATALWQGTDTSLIVPTTQQYVGGLTQITQQATILAGASIIDGLKSQVAFMMSNVIFKPKPTAFYLNPTLADLIDAEAKAQHFQLDTVEVVAGVVVEALQTQAGKLPLIGDVYMPTTTGAAYGFAAPPAGQSNYFCAILTESMVEIAYVSGETANPYPRIFELGLIGNLNGQFVSVLFDCPIFKGYSYAHSVVCVQH